MEYSQFLERVVERRIEIGTFHKSMSWRFLYLFKKASGDIDYKCGFDSEGCRNQSTSYKNTMCCCRGCYNSVGHFTVLPSNPRLLKALAKLFKEGQGFWREDKGCILPRAFRSMTCIGYDCMTTGEIRRLPKEQQLYFKVLGRIGLSNFNLNDLHKLYMKFLKQKELYFKWIYCKKRDTKIFWEFMIDVTKQVEEESDEKRK